ncbi:hypothetical protein [Glycomyces sp. NPDC048151]|uniref:hypothetical protein n=1 Tax=Glycomyces sp. NPDC048151 TaxID=3364002 RepID=UPI00371EFEDE
MIILVDLLSVQAVRSQWGDRLYTRLDLLTDFILRGIAAKVVESNPESPVRSMEMAGSAYPDGVTLRLFSISVNLLAVHYV